MPPSPSMHSTRLMHLLGISYDVDETSVVTRIMPTGEDADGNLLYLPELYIDSPNINAYPHPKWIHLAVSEAKEVTEDSNKDDDEDPRKTKAQCYEEMRKAAAAEYEKDCDLPTITLKVDFIDCANTEEYKQYRALTEIFLGDAVRVIAPRIGVEVSMRMTQYTYDCLLKKYTSVTLGTVADTIEGNMIFHPPVGGREHYRGKAGHQLRGHWTASVRGGRLLADQECGHRRRAHPERFHHAGAHCGSPD